MGQPVIPPTPPSVSLAGKSIVVTGANTGLGLEAVHQFILLGAKTIVLAVRTLSKGEEAVKYLWSHPSVQPVNPKPELKVMQLDLDDYQSVVRFADNVKKDLGTLDILLLNGGVNIMNFQRSVSGHERVMQVNFLSNALLAFELLPLLQQTATKTNNLTRLSWVGSEAQKINSITKKPIPSDRSVLEYFDDKSKYASMTRYSETKLLVSMFVQSLANKVSSDKVVVNNFCPGMVMTNFDSHLPLWLKTIMAVVRRIRARSVEEGSRTLIFASAVAGPNTHGEFLSSNEKIGRAHV